MVWKASTKVGYAVSGPWAAARYCEAAANAGEPAAFIENVLPRCIEEGVDTCFNEAQLKLHNDYRSDHKDTPPLKGNEEAASAIQKMIDGLTEGEKAADPFEFPGEDKRPEGF
jgi:hypothetical protein